MLIYSSQFMIFARDSLKNRDILKEDYQKALTMLRLFFLSKPVSFDAQDCEKQKESEASDQ